jgi:DNA-binding Xre family transcriptional regulator
MKKILEDNKILNTEKNNKAGMGSAGTKKLAKNKHSP